jgi:phosphate starvation-inducible membrane PsiE
VAMSEEICQFILCLEGEKYAEIYWCSKRQKVPTLAECLQCFMCPRLLFCNFYLYMYLIGKNVFTLFTGDLNLNYSNSQSDFKTKIIIIFIYLLTRVNPC